MALLGPGTTHAYPLAGVPLAYFLSLFDGPYYPGPCTAFASNTAYYFIFIIDPIVWDPLPLFLVVVLSLIEHTTGRRRVIPILVVTPLVPLVPALGPPLKLGALPAGGYQSVFRAKRP